MKNKPIYSPPSFPMIEAATQGDAIAIQGVLDHYSRYISTLCTRPFKDVNGNTHYAIDPYIRRRLEAKLVTRILKFKII